jgi:peptidyl-prolyl cis-trans isomerase C
MELTHMVHTRVINMRRSPALHFLVIGGLLFAAAMQQGALGSFEKPPRLVIPRYRIDLARQQFMQERGRPPTPAEAKKILDILVEREVLYQHALRLGMHKETAAERRLAQIAAFVEQNPHELRTQAERAQEAVDLGLHQGDLVVRRILIDGARRLIRAAALVRQPTNDMLEAYLRKNPDQFTTPAKTRITHITVNRLKHGAETETRARVILEKLRVGSYTPEDAISFGDRAFVPPALPLLTDKDLARRFGYRFVQALKTAPESVWSGPIASRYGLHFVYVHERKEPSVPPLDKIRKREGVSDLWISC